MTVRLFDPAPTRHRQVLDGSWEFVTDPDDAGRERGYHESFPATADRVAVPGSWNLREAYFEYGGPAWYRTTFSLPEAANVRLRFEAVSHAAEVFLDGDAVASHVGGYTPFETVEAGLAAGEHELVVRADSDLGDATVPHDGSDWFPFGGITREVVVEAVPDVFVAGVDAEYELDGNSASVEATVAVRNLGPATEEAVAVEVAGARASDTVAVDAGASTVSLSLDATAVDRWSLDDPTLYDLVARVGDDEYRDRIGFREISVDGTDVLLNGDPVAFRGVNRHEAHPDLGPVQSPHVLEQDLDVIERAGMNVIRTAHYPNHPRFLDYCDERGILVIEEIPYWQFDSEQFETDGVVERGEQFLREMISRDRHHPSIALWSLTNECENQEAGVRDATERLAETARALDDSRPLTLASRTDWMRGTEDLAEAEYVDECYQFVDVLCINGYPGWYGDGDWTAKVAEMRELYEEKPIVVTEFGAGAVEGERTWGKQKWSEGYQADVLADAIETFEASDDVAGFTVWQFCDTRTHPDAALKRPKTKNNKGIVSEYRRPKEAYWRVRDLLVDE